MTVPQYPSTDDVAAQRRANRRMYAAIAALAVVWAGVLVLRTPIQARYWAWQLTRSHEPNAHRHYFHRLASLRDACVPAAARLIEHDRAEVRNTGALLLHYARTPKSRELLLGCLSDEDAEVRRTAAMGLALDDSPEVVDALRATLAGQDEQAAALAAAALGRMGGQQAEAALLAALRDQTRLLVKAEAIDGLGQLRSDEAVPLLIDALGDDRRLPEPTISDRLAARAFQASAAELARKHPASQPAASSFSTPTTISELAARSLRLLTGRSFGFDPTLPPDRKAAIIEQWRAAAARK